MIDRALTPLLLGAALALAAPAHGAGEAAPTLRFGGELDWSLFGYLRDTDPAGGVPGRNQIQVQPHLKARYGKLGATVEIQFRHDFLDPERSRILLKDAYAQARWGGFKIRAGNQVIRWGRMDMRPALDLLTPRDYDELWNPERLASPALLLSYGHPSVAVSVAWLPTFTPSRYPVGDHHRWQVLRAQPELGVAGSETFPIHYREYRDPEVTGDPPFLDGQYGARLELFLPRIDLGVQGYYGRDLLPTYHRFEGLNGDVMEPTAQDLITFLDEGVDVALIPVFAHKGVVGGDFALVLGRVVVKGEVAYTFTPDAAHERCDVPDPYLQGTVGVEWIANDLIGTQDLQVRFEVAGDHELPPSDDGVINRDDHCDVPATATPIVDMNHLSVLAFYGNVQWGFSDHVALDLRGFVGIEGDYLLRTELSYTARDRLRLGLGLLLLGGFVDDRFMTHYDRNDRVEFSATYLF